jgi:hypothetical protein
MCCVFMELEDNWPPTVRDAVNKALSATYSEYRWRDLVPFVGDFGMRELAEDFDYAFCRLEDVIEENKGLRAANSKAVVANKKLSAASMAAAREKRLLDTEIATLVADNDRLLKMNAGLRAHTSKMAEQLRIVGVTLDKVLSIAQNIKANADEIDARLHPNKTPEPDVSTPKSDAQEAAFDSFGQPIVSAPCGREGLGDDVKRVTGEYFALRRHKLKGGPHDRDEFAAFDKELKKLADGTRNECIRNFDRDNDFCRREHEYDEANSVHPIRSTRTGDYKPLTVAQVDARNAVESARNLSIERFIAIYSISDGFVRFRNEDALVEFLTHAYRLFKIHYDLDLENVQTHHIRSVLAEEEAFVRVSKDTAAIQRSKVRSSTLRKLFEMIVGKRRD